MSAVTEQWTQRVIAGVVVVFTLFTLWGVNGTVNGLEDRVNDLEDEIATLEEVEQRIVTLRADLEELSRVRQDILEAICIANADSPRDAQRCRDANG